MQETKQKTRSKTWFRAQIPSSVNDGLKRIAKDKTALYRGTGAEFTKERVIVALLKVAVEAKQSGSLLGLAEWLFDGCYNGDIMEIKAAPNKNGKAAKE